MASDLSAVAVALKFDSSAICPGLSAPFPVLPTAYMIASATMGVWITSEQLPGKMPPSECDSPAAASAEFQEFTRRRSPRFRPRADTPDSSDDVEFVQETQLTLWRDRNDSRPPNKRVLAPWTLVASYDSKDAALAAMSQFEEDGSGWSKGQRYGTTQEFKCGIMKRFSGCPMKVRTKILPDGRCLLERLHRHDHRPELDKSKGVKWAARKVVTDIVNHRAIKPKHMTQIVRQSGKQAPKNKVRHCFRVLPGLLCC